MNTFPRFFSKPLAWLAIPALAGSLLLGACNSEPQATDVESTATVVENPDVPPVTADSTAADTTAQ